MSLRYHIGIGWFDGFGLCGCLLDRPPRQWDLVHSVREFSWRRLDGLGRDDRPSNSQNKIDRSYCKLLATIPLESHAALDAGGCLPVHT